MTQDQSRKLAGLLFLIIPLLLNIPFGLLAANFQYPEILRQPAHDVLLKFHQGGPSLIMTWWLFGILGLPLFHAMIVLHSMLQREDTPYLPTATTFGLLSLLIQLVGLLRWTFVVPGLANIVADPAASTATKEAATVSFQTMHQFGGVELGEHLGQLFTILWMFMTGIAMLKSGTFKPWLGWFGIIAALVYAPAQLELFATVIPALPVIAPAGIAGSLLWLTWMILTATSILRRSMPR